MYQSGYSNRCVYLSKLSTPRRPRSRSGDARTLTLLQPSFGTQLSEAVGDVEAKGVQVVYKENTSHGAR